MIGYTGSISRFAFWNASQDAATAGDYRDQPYRGAGQRADARQQPDQPGADQQRKQGFGPDRPIRANEIVALQDLFDQLRVDLDTWNIRGERRRLAIIDHPGR